ncbi:hypothetical protein HanXRQr2_Chr13g0599211 [Helianthus annuus]|uniref:Uncharacterized protein n=1 Tax=Helianthus annuus TaxID=4232 RepID=A0A9K3HCU3_HELAN|nr:hypothetical protein HanXRQr2_Chr13g0599211 [Helianthus annuus]KAJ0850157.1 hypothetical protein HanPSC8_Chr13g0577321 [Helianthus annuus]
MVGLKPTIGIRAQGEDEGRFESRFEKWSSLLAAGLKTKKEGARVITSGDQKKEERQDRKLVY